MMQSFEAEATKVLLKFTARSVMSPFQAEKYKYFKQTNKTTNKYLMVDEHAFDGIELTSCPRQLAKQYAVSIDQIFTSRSSEPVITYLPDRSNMAAGNEIIKFLSIP